MKRRQFVKTASAFSLASVPFLKSNLASAMDGFSNAKAAGFKATLQSVEHERSFMQWPINPTIYPTASELENVQQAIALIANRIIDYEPVTMLAAKSLHPNIAKLLDQRVELWDVPTDDFWCRDCGPLFLLNAKSELAASNLNFNGWGNKQSHGQDAKICERLAERLEIKLFNNGLTGEGGGAEFDGTSTLIAHESSWVNKNRNSGSRADVERALLESYGASKVVWAPGVADKNKTDAHIASLARFSEEGVIFIQQPEQMDPYDPWSRSAFETMAILSEVQGSDGSAFEVIDVGGPFQTRVETEGFLASYPNYYVCNGAVFYAQYGDDEADTVAKRTLEELYPRRTIIALNVDQLGKFGAGIHSAVLHQPKSSSIWAG